MATTFDVTALGRFVGTNAPYGKGSFGIVKLNINIPKILSEKPISVLDGSAADILQVWDIPVGCAIFGVLLAPTTVEGATTTVTVGDVTNAAGYLAASSINALTKVGTVVGDAYGAAHKVYSSSTPLTLTFGTEATITTAIFDIYVYCMFCEDVM